MSAGQGMQRRIVSAGFVADALEPLVRRGIDPAPLLAGAGIAAADGPVTNQEYGRLWLAVAEALDDEFFGLGARPMRPGGFVFLGHAVLHAATLNVALRRALRFLGVLLEDPSGSLRVADGQAEIVLSDRRGLRSAFAYRTYWLVLMGLSCWLIGRRIPLTRLDFACAAPPNRADYQRFFGAPVQFGQTESRLCFAARYLELPTIRDERALKLFLAGAPANILVRYRHDQGLSARIRVRLRGTDPALWPDLEQVARELALSPATLRRRLRAEGQGWQAIRDDLRFAESRRLLAGTGESVAAIALRVGYAEPSAFHRAFLKWSGETPAAYRAARAG